MNKLKCELYFVNSQKSSSAKLAFARHNHERLTDSNTTINFIRSDTQTCNHPLQRDHGPNSAVTTTKLHPLWQDATSWIKIAMLLHELEHSAWNQRTVGQTAVHLFVEFVLRADRLCHFMPNQSWSCVSHIWTGQLVSLRIMIHAVHGEAPIIEGNSMYLELA